MTSINLTIELPDTLARDAQQASLLRITGFGIFRCYIADKVC